MWKPSCETSEVNEVLRCVVTALHSGYAFGCHVVTCTRELTEVQEPQLYPGWGNPDQEFAKELERQFSAGRIVLALCPMLSIGGGKIHRDIHVAAPYCDDPVLHRYALSLVAAQLQLR